MESLLLIKSPMELRDVHRLCRQIQRKLRITGYKELDLQNVHSARTSFEILISVLTSKMLNVEPTKSKSTKIISHFFRSDLGRIQRMLDDKESEYLGETSKINFPNITAYSRLIESYLENLIIEPLFYASRASPGNQERFLFELFRAFVKNISIFGVDTRTDGVRKQSLLPLQIPQTFEEFQGDDFQKELENAYETEFEFAQKFKDEAEGKIRNVR